MILKNIIFEKLRPPRWHQFQTFLFHIWFTVKVLVIGSGGREHAIIWKLAQSPRVTQLFCAPGNAGIESLATCVPLAVDDLPAQAICDP